MAKKVGSLPGGRCSLLATVVFAALAATSLGQWPDGSSRTDSSTPAIGAGLSAGTEEYPGWVTARLPRFRQRHIGWGQPLEGTSWRNRPFYFGWLVGGLFGESVNADRLDQGQGIFGGYRFGYDLSHYWGTELRMAFGYLDATYRPEGIRAGDVENSYGDINLLYYPWGDSRWRPFASIGMGVAGFHYLDRDGRGVSESLFAVPWGFGLKYQWRHWMTIRMDVTDNVAFGQQDLNTMHNWSLTGGLEVHWGGDRSAKYRPW